VFAVDRVKSPEVAAFALGTVGVLLMLTHWACLYVFGIEAPGVLYATGFALAWAAFAALLYLAFIRGTEADPLEASKRRKRVRYNARTKEQKKNTNCQ
jgi:hypothetical protein